MKTCFVLLVVAFVFTASAVDEYAGVKVMYADIDPYHEGAPGPWDGKQGLHVPVLEIDEAENRASVRVGAERHEMVPGPDPPTHWIGYIWVKDQTGIVVPGGGIKLGFGDDPELFFYISESSTELTAYQACNLHGIWRSETFKLNRGDGLGEGVWGPDPDPPTWSGDDFGWGAQDPEPDPEPESSWAWWRSRDDTAWKPEPDPPTHWSEDDFGWGAQDPEPDPEPESSWAWWRSRDDTAWKSMS